MDIEINNNKTNTVELYANTILKFKKLFYIAAVILILMGLAGALNVFARVLGIDGVGVTLLYIVAIPTLYTTLLPVVSIYAIIPFVLARDIKRYKATEAQEDNLGIYKKYINSIQVFWVLVIMQMIGIIVMSIAPLLVAEGENNWAGSTMILFGLPASIMAFAGVGLAMLGYRKSLQYLTRISIPSSAATYARRVTKIVFAWSAVSLVNNGMVIFLYTVGRHLL